MKGFRPIQGPYEAALLRVNDTGKLTTPRTGWVIIFLETYRLSQDWALILVWRDDTSSRKESV